MEGLGSGLTLDAGEIAIVGAIIGGLWGTILFLLKVVVSTKDGSIDLLKEEVHSVQVERDYFRDKAFGDTHVAE